MGCIVSVFPDGEASVFGRVFADSADETKPLSVLEGFQLLVFVDDDDIAVFGDALQYDDLCFFQLPAEYVQHRAVQGYDIEGGPGIVFVLYGTLEDVDEIFSGMVFADGLEGWDAFFAGVFVGTGDARRVN